MLSRQMLVYDIFKHSAYKNIKNKKLIYEIQKVNHKTLNIIYNIIKYIVPNFMMPYHSIN